MSATAQPQQRHRQLRTEIHNLTARLTLGELETLLSMLRGLAMLLASEDTAKVSPPAEEV